MFCGCGVTLYDGNDECFVCAASPHERECGCDECVAYWTRIEAESKVAADWFRTSLVCSCGWVGMWAEHHTARRPNCTLTRTPFALRSDDPKGAADAA